MSAKIQPECNKTDVTDVAYVTASICEAFIGNTEKNIDVTHVTGLLDGAIDPNEEAPEILPTPDEVKRPYYKVYDDFTAFGKAGVYYHCAKTDKQGNVIEYDDFICDPLHIDAGSCDGGQNNFGLMLRFRNQRYQWRKWLMPLDMLAGSCEELRAQLLRQGLRIDHHKRVLLPSYLQSQRPKKQLECALKVGWHDDCFVLPDRVIGSRDDVFFQSDHAVTAEYGQRGSLKDWQQNISRYCINNPLLILQTSIGFAGALLKKYSGPHCPDNLLPSLR